MPSPLFKAIVFTYAATVKTVGTGADQIVAQCVVIAAHHPDAAFFRKVPVVAIAADDVPEERTVAADGVVVCLGLQQDAEALVGDPIIPRGVGTDLVSLNDVAAGGPFFDADSVARVAADQVVRTDCVVG